MKPIQHIADLHLELCFESDDPRPQPMAEDDLLAMAREHILSTLAETLEREDDGRHRHIARLDIDLGECTAYDYAAEIPPLLARLLSEALARHDSEAAAATSGRPTAEQREPLEHFLLTGHMPSSPAGAAGDASRASHERLLAPWLAAPAGDDLKTLLRRCATSPGAVRRLAQQFESGTLRQVVQRVETPERAAGWLSLVDVIDAALTPAEASRRQDLRQFWEILLNQVLGGATGSASSAASATLRQAATVVANGNATIPSHAAALLRMLATATIPASNDGHRASDEHEAIAGSPPTALYHANEPYQGAQMRQITSSRVDAQLATPDANDYPSSTGISAVETLWADIERHIGALPGGGAPLMLNAVHARAADSANRPAFLRRVSEALRHDQAIDLEEIEAAISTTSSEDERTTDITPADVAPDPRAIEARAYPTLAGSSESIPSISIAGAGRTNALRHGLPALETSRFRRTLPTPPSRTLLKALRTIGIRPVRRSPTTRCPMRAESRPRRHILQKKQRRQEPSYELSRFDEPSASGRTIVELDASENVSHDSRLRLALLDGDLVRVSSALVGASSQTVLAAMRQVGNRPDVWLRIAHFPPTLLLQLTWAAAPPATNILLAPQSTDGDAIDAAAGAVNIDLNDPWLWQRCLTCLASVPFEANAFRAALRATTLASVTAPGVPDVSSVPQPLTMPPAVHATAAPIEDDQPAPRAPFNRSSGHSGSGEQSGILRRTLLDADEARAASALATASNETVVEALRKIDDSDDIWQRIAHFSPTLPTHLAATQHEPHALSNQTGQPHGIVPASPHEPLAASATTPAEPADRSHQLGEPFHAAALATESPEAPPVEALWPEVSAIIATQSSVAPDAGQPSLLARAVRSRAAESHNPEAFLQAVLVALRDQRMLDLDDIEEQIQHPNAAVIQETETPDASGLLRRIEQQVGAGAGGQRMMEAIAQHADASQAPAAYLRHVLEDVMASRAIDLEELDMLYGQLTESKQANQTPSGMGLMQPPKPLATKTSQAGADVLMAAPSMAALPNPAPAAVAATSTYVTMAAATTHGATEKAEFTAATPAPVPNATVLAATSTTQATAAAGAIMAVADTAVATETDVANSDVAIAVPTDAVIVAATDMATSTSADAAISAPVDAAATAAADLAITDSADLATVAAATAIAVAAAAAADAATAAAMDAANAAAADVASTANAEANAQTTEQAASEPTSSAPATIPVSDIPPSQPQSASISTTAAPAVLSTSTKRSGKTEIVVRHPAPPRRAPGGELARVLARHVPARRAALTAMLRNASDDIDDLAPGTIHNIVKLLAGTDLQTMTRHASDVRALAAHHLPHPPSTGLEFETVQFDLDWFFIQGRNFVAADYAHALAAWLCRHIAGAAEPLHEALHSRLGIPRPAPPVPRATAISPTHSNHNGTRTTTPHLGQAAPDLEIDALLVDNAGQVLIGPYMPRLFSMLGLTEAGQFKDAEAAERAVHLLQCVVGGPSDTPEAMLGLNKILCGVPAATAIAREITITEQERDTVEMMLRAIIEHWKKIGNTTPDGLRQSFLRRTGRMHLKDDAWYLNVEPGTFDMLLDSLPWSFSIIKHPWMERAVHVNWR